MKIMKYTTMLLILFALVYSGPVDVQRLSSGVSREPASFYKSCRDCFLAFTDKAKLSVQYPRRILNLFNYWDRQKFLKFFKKLSYKTRLNYLNFLGLYAGKESEFYSLRFAEIVNDALLDDLITLHQAKQLVDTLKKAGNRQLFYSDSLHSIQVYTMSSKHLKDQIEISFQGLLNDTDLPHKFIDRYKNFFHGLDLFPEPDLRVLFANINNLPETEEGFLRFTRYIEYASSFTHSQRLKAFEEIKHLDDVPVRKNSHIARFEKVQQKFDNYEVRMRDKLYQQKMRKTHNAVKSAEEAKVEAFKRRQIYEKLSYGCRAKRVNQEHLVASKRFMKIYMSMAAAGAVGSHLIHHGHEEKDRDWFKKLGFDVSVAVIMHYIGAKIKANPHSSFTQKYMQTFFTQSAAAGPIATAYAKLFGVSEEVVEAKFEELKNDPEFQYQITKLLNYLDKEKVEEKFIKLMDQHYIKDGNSYKEVTRENIDDEQVKDMLLEAIARQAYQSEQGHLIATGNKGMDYFLFNRGFYLAFGTANSLVMGTIIYKTLCMGGVNPTHAAAKIITVFAIDHLVFHGVLFGLQKYSIGN
jgi:hypothetical protein